MPYTVEDAAECYARFGGRSLKNIWHQYWTHPLLFVSFHSASKCCLRRWHPNDPGCLNIQTSPCGQGLDIITCCPFSKHDGVNPTDFFKAANLDMDEELGTGCQHCLFKFTLLPVPCLCCNTVGTQVFCAPGCKCCIEPKVKAVDAAAGPILR